MKYKKPAFAFPGVSIPMCGSEPDFYHRHVSLMRPVLEEGGDYAGIDFLSALEGPDSPVLDELGEQLFFYSVSCGIGTVYLHHGIQPHCMAGYSLGIYAALYMTDTISFQAGLAMIREAYRLSQKACAGQTCGMAIILGLDQREIKELIEKPDYSSIRKVNANNHLAALVSGDLETLERFVAETMEKDAYKARLLDVNLPFHNPDYLAEASVQLKIFLQTLEWNRPVCPIVSSIDQRFLNDPDDLLQFTAENISTPISWQEVIHAMKTRDIDLVIECGPGISLTQNSRMINKCPKFVNIKNCRQRLNL